MLLLLLLQIIRDEVKAGELPPADAYLAAAAQQTVRRASDGAGGQPGGGLFGAVHTAGRSRPLAG